MEETRPEKTSSYLPPAIFFIVSLLFTLPFILKWGYIGVGDWELFTTMAAVPARTILYYHQFPFWNPYIGGGNILFAHPEVGILSPFLPLVLFFGAVAGLKLYITAAYFLGFWGSFLFARRLGLSDIASYLVSFVYFGNSYFGGHFSIGHIPFTHFCFLPWFLYFILKSDDNWKNIFGAIVSIALIILGNGAAIPFLYTLFFSGVFIILFSIESQTLRYIKTFLISALAGILLAGVKFIPMYYYLSQNKWEGMPNDFTPLNLVLPAFFSFDQFIFRAQESGQYWGWHEYSAYISPLVVLLAIVGIIFAFKKSRLWLIIAIFFFIFGLGHFADFSLWNLIMQLPGFSSIRSPARAFQFVILAIAIIGGYGMDYLLSKTNLSQRLSRYLATGLVVAILITNFLINLPSLQTIDLKQPGNIAFSDNFRQEIGRKDNIYNQFLENRGSLVAPWLSGYKESRGLVTPTNDVLTEYLLSGKLEVSSRRYTPNWVEYIIAPTEPGTIIFGIGYDNGWHSIDGRPIFEQNGLVATNFTLNDKKVILDYRAPYFLLGLLVTIFSAALGLLFLLNRKFGHWLEAILK